MPDRPSGIVTFLATDIEQSTRRWEEQHDTMRVELARHDRILQDVIRAKGGWLFKHTGDGVIAAFASPRAAIAAQNQLELPVRMGICTGEVESRDDDYFGPALNRATRTMNAGHGGQVLVAASTAAIVTDVDFIDLGEHRLRDLSQPQRLFQVQAEGLKKTFPALRTLTTAPGNLPAQATSFLGRDKDLAEVGAPQEILAGCPQVSLLATSREALRVDGERSWPVPSLGFRDGVTSPAVMLFVERARSVEPHFDLGSDGDTVCEICRRLDGIPLAIELAAARIRAISTSQIRDRLHERFRLLTGGSRRALERHQTLRHAVEWSYDLLSSAERVVLSRASVFAGGFTLEASESVCSGGDIAASDILDLLDSLVRKSLVTVERSDAAVRYGLLETIRQFAEEQLATTGESEAGRLRHAQFFAEDAEAQYEIYWGPRQLLAYQWLDQELDNLRSAFRWASDHEDVDIAARIASSIGTMARYRLHEEAANWALEVVDAARRVGHRRLGVLLALASDSARSFGGLREAKLYGEQAIALADAADFDQFVWAFIELATVALYEGDTGRAIELARAGAAHPADRRYRTCLAFLPFFLILGGASDEAKKIVDGVVAEVRSTGIPILLVVALQQKGNSQSRSDPARALVAFDQALTIARESGNRMLEVLLIPVIAATQARSGAPTTALHSFLPMLDSWHRSNDPIFVSHGISALIFLFERLGDPPAAATINGFLTKTFESTAFARDLPDIVARLRQALSEVGFGEATKRGAAMTQREVVDYAADRIQHALTALGAGVTTD